MLAFGGGLCSLSTSSQSIIIATADVVAINVVSK